MIPSCMTDDELLRHCEAEFYANAYVMELVRRLIDANYEREFAEAGAQFAESDAADSETMYAVMAGELDEAKEKLDTLGKELAELREQLTEKERA